MAITFGWISKRIPHQKGSWSAPLKGIRTDGSAFSMFMLRACYKHKDRGFFPRQIYRLCSCQLGCTSKNAPNSDGHPRWIQGVAPWVKMLAMGWTSKTGRWRFIWGHVVSDNIIGPSSYETKTWTQSTASETVAINHSQWVNGDDLVKWVS